VVSEPLPGGTDLAPLVPEPDSDMPDVDRGDELPSDGLPPEGLARRPAMPAVDRDMLSPRQHGAGRGAALAEIAHIGEDVYLDLDLMYVFKVGEWRIAPRLPMRLRLIDESPETDGVVRKEDWDEASDWARLLAFVQYGGYGQAFFVRYGELNGVTIGHGSLVNRYFNTIDVDHYQGGLFAGLDGGFAGGEVLLDNVLDPELFVGRGYVRPFSLFESWPRVVRDLKFGVTAGADVEAPLAVATGHGGFFAHPDWQPVVLADEVAGLFGVDVEVPAVSLPHLDLVPYLDVATVDGKGAGLHLGTYFNVRFNRRNTLNLRLEYRFQGEGYEPGYISPFYEIQRFSHLGGDPKLDLLRRGEIGHEHSGFYVEGDLKLGTVFRYTALYATRGGKRGQDLMMRLRLRDVGPLRLSLFFGRVGFDGLDNLFAADRTVWGTSLRVLLTDWFFVTGTVVNEWWLRHEEDGAGYFETTTNFSFGVGLQIQVF